MAINMGTLNEKTSKMLIRESKRHLAPYHINLRKYTATVTQNEEDITATVIFTSKESGANIYVGCFYKNEEILQAEVYL